MALPVMLPPMLEAIEKFDVLSPEVGELVFLSRSHSRNNGESGTVTYVIPEGAEFVLVEILCVANDAAGALQNDVSYKLEYDGRPLIFGSDPDVNANPEFRATPDIRWLRVNRRLKGGRSVVLTYRNFSGATRVCTPYLEGVLYRNSKKLRKE